MLTYKKTLDIDELIANHATVSVHKYGFSCAGRGGRKSFWAPRHIIYRVTTCAFTPQTRFCTSSKGVMTWPEYSRKTTLTLIIRW